MIVTTLTASLLGLIFLVLSFGVIVQRRRAGLSIGPGTENLGRGEAPDKAPLLIATRSHANFAEYVPLSLILLGLLEYKGFTREVLYGLAAALVLARILHPIGMWMMAPNMPRAIGILLQWAMLLVASVLGLYCVLNELMLNPAP
ncbi:MAG TPA: hypothetical protein DCL54_05500 [Alphaproteobacteria bacterium]|nr:hypothetical protein [Alphaproteobacteria bacterium]HAJ46018.1 hypothetical protein [Alphaproteobacteria bacterium]